MSEEGVEMKPHKHAELIKAWADGNKIQMQAYDGTWIDDEDPCWSSEDFQFRIKPQPKPKDVVYTTYIDYEFAWDWVNTTSSKHPNLKLIFDGETGKLKSAEAI